jgi:hypothetical protein
MGAGRAGLFSCGRAGARGSCLATCTEPPCPPWRAPARPAGVSAATLSPPPPPTHCTLRGCGLHGGDRGSKVGAWVWRRRCTSRYRTCPSRHPRPPTGAPCPKAGALSAPGARQGRAASLPGRGPAGSTASPPPPRAPRRAQAARRPPRGARRPPPRATGDGRPALAAGDHCFLFAGVWILGSPGCPPSRAPSTGRPHAGCLALCRPPAVRSPSPRAAPRAFCSYPHTAPGRCHGCRHEAQPTWGQDPAPGLQAPAVAQPEALALHDGDLPVGASRLKVARVQRAPGHFRRGRAPDDGLPQLRRRPGARIGGEGVGSVGLWPAGQRHRPQGALHQRRGG